MFNNELKYSMVKLKNIVNMQIDKLQLLTNILETRRESGFTRELRSSNARSLVMPRETGTFQDSAAKLFNSLPGNIRKCCNYSKFLALSKGFLKNEIVT